ncbi:flagellar motor protein MotB [Pannonibacter sp. Pt2-lr]
MSAGLQANEIIIVRRRASLESDTVKGGVWKIAFADFMTAMMAFFLVMWLINVTDESVRKGVAQYFNPVKLASTTQTRKGLNDPDVPGPEITNPAKIDVQMETTPDPDGSPGAANGSDATGSMPLREGLVAGRRAGEFNPTLSEAQLSATPMLFWISWSAHLGINWKPEWRLKLLASGSSRPKALRAVMHSETRLIRCTGSFSRAARLRCRMAGRQLQ